MTVRKFSDQGFDDFRKERKRMRAKIGPQGASHGYDNQALRELEQVEAREVRDQQLTREVHDFFAAATKQAAAIVERVAHDAQQVTGARVEQEMESFLIDSLARMNTLVLTVLHQRRSGIAETHIEPSIGNLVGTTLDEFRFAGTADVGDKHIGQDPFATAVDEVQREFREQVTPRDQGAGAVPIDQHLVATVQPEQGSNEVVDAAAEQAPPEAPPEPKPTLPAVAATTRTTAAVPPVQSPREPVLDTDRTRTGTEDDAGPHAPGEHDDLDRFKDALRSLVRTGVMTRDEARAAWQTRLRTLADKA